MPWLTASRGSRRMTSSNTALASASLPAQASGGGVPTGDAPGRVDLQGPQRLDFAGRVVTHFLYAGQVEPHRWQERKALGCLRGVFKRLVEPLHVG